MFQHRSQAVREENGINDVGREATPNQESAEDTQSLDLDIQSEISDRETRTASASSRPRIEDKLGLTSDNDDDDDDEPDAGQSDSSDKTSTLDDTVVSDFKQLGWDYELGEDELASGGVLNPKEAAEQLAALKEQQHLLTKLVEQQEQMRALRDRQSALLALQQDAEQKLDVAREKRNEAREISSSLEESASNMEARVDALDVDNPALPADSDLNDLRQQLQYLRNELKSQNLQQPQAGQKNQKAETVQRKVPPPRPPSPKIAEVPPTQMSREQIQAKLNELLQKKDRIDQFMETELTAPPVGVSADMDRDQLVDKLQELQTKKRRMDEMLQELHSIKDNPHLNLNNVSVTAAESGGAPSGVQVSEGEAALAMAEGTENMANDVLGLLGARDKLGKLNEVRGRLNQMKSLMHYYQSDGAAVRPMEGAEPSLLPADGVYQLEPEVTRDTGPATAFNEMGGQFMRQLQDDRKPVAETTKPKVNIPVQPQPQSDENNSSSDSESESESQLSSLGPWGDDPEIQEKVRKLKAAKEKLRNLQSLVAMVQHSPDVASELPENIAEIAASIEDVESQLTQTDDRNNASVSEGEVPITQTDRDAYYQGKMQEQLEELDQLKDEKSRLLAIQTQLQTLHDRFQQTEGDKTEGREETKPKSRPHSQPQQVASSQSTGPSVTFSSNEEVYDKMRKQRMLREELRDKKKQLESIMKKDRNKKQYYRNQDNQSDAVSYTTDTFGASASADATMATWGGSTVDNLESITEDGRGDQPDIEDDDDAYPSDGILQVEEEEEENNSDNETYTIEDDVRQRRKARVMARPNVEGNLREGKTKRSFPQPNRGEAARPKEGNWTGNQPSFSHWSRHPKSKQENYVSAEEIVQEGEGVGGPAMPQVSMETLQQQLEQTSRLCQSVLADQQSGGARQGLAAPGYGGGGMMNQLPDLQQQLQQQQLMMSLNQCYQQIAIQQMDIQNMQRQMQSVLYRTADGSDVAESLLAPDTRVRSMNSVFSPMLPRPSPQNPTDGFVFSPQLARSDRLLRGAIPEDTTLLESEKSYPGAEANGELQVPDAQRNLFRKFQKRQTRSESSVQKLKKKMASPPQPKTNSMAVQANLRLHPTEETRTSAPDKPVPPLEFERYLARKKREFSQRHNLPIDAVPQTSDTGQRSSTTQTSGQKAVEEYRPGLSAGISGAGYLEDGRSIASSAQSSVAAMAQSVSTQAKEQRDSDDNNEMSLFETLRETIYSEVATLISQNENRPHYLIELFRELQLLSTDYLRQRVLYDIKDVVSKYLVDENSESMSAPPPLWMNPVVNNFATSELTPSESLVTSDDEEVKAKLRDSAPASDRHKAAILQRTGSLKNDEFDYQEAAEVTSSVSTPSNSYWESPFAKDSLGDTVIHLDKTLQRMREYEKKLAEKETRVKAAEEGREVASPALDQGSESSVTSDTVPYPRIDTQQLDQQIKAIMTEVIPVIKEHMDNMCSPQLLAYIKRLVLSLTRQYDSGQEFARFFHRQLGSILQDSLVKYEGRKMRECGEDLLVDMSEVLFNELAFFRLMQDLDDPLIAEKMRQAQAWSDSEDDKDEELVESDTTESSTATGDETAYDSKLTQTEEEDLGKTRDDAFASEVAIRDADDKDEEPESPFKSSAVQIQLAPSETKPYTRIGSDEDDEDEDADSQSNEDPSETAVSLNAKMDVEYADDFEEAEDSELEKQDGDGMASPTGQINTAQGLIIMGPKPTQEREVQGQITPDQGDADQGAATSGKVEPVCNSVEHMNGDLNGDMEIISMDELPPSLSIMTAEELQARLLEEQGDNAGAAAILTTVHTPAGGELAGDPQHLKEPDEASG